MLEPILLILLLMLSAGFSGTETALFSLPETELAALRRDGGSTGRGVAALLARPSRLLAALLIGNLLVNTLASVLATSMLVERLGAAGLALAVPVMTLVLLLAGEITPKLIALRQPLRVARVIRLPITVWLALNRPLLHVIDLASEALLARLPLERSGSRRFSVEELVTATELSVHDAALTETEGRFVSRLLQLDELEVREIMTPRTDAVTLDPDADRDAVRTLAAGQGHNRYPVMGPDDARPTGVFHLKDLLAAPEGAPPARSRQRDPVFVPESKSVAELLNEFRRGGQHMAFVVDEHGDFAGLVTLEDCLEALTGPWRDESDVGAADVLPVADRNWVARGGADLRRVNEVCGTRIPGSHDYVTLAGHVMAGLGRIPVRGDRLTEGGVRFTVLDMEGHRIRRIRVQTLEASDERGGEA